MPEMYLIQPRFRYHAFVTFTETEKQKNRNPSPPPQKKQEIKDMLILKLLIEYYVIKQLIC